MQVTPKEQVSSPLRTPTWGGLWWLSTRILTRPGLEDVMWAVATRCEASKSIDIVRNAWSSHLDPRIHPDDKERGATTHSKLIIEACRPFSWKDQFPVPTAMSPDAARRIMAKWNRVLDAAATSRTLERPELLSALMSGRRRNRPALLLLHILSEAHLARRSIWRRRDWPRPRDQVRVAMASGFVANRQLRHVTERLRRNCRASHRLSAFGNTLGRKPCRGAEKP